MTTSKKVELGALIKIFALLKHNLFFSALNWGRRKFHECSWNEEWNKWNRFQEFRTDFNTFNAVKLYSYVCFYRKVNWERKVQFRSAFHWVYGLRLTAKLVHMHYVEYGKLFQILITRVALHTLRHEFSWQPHSFTHHAFAARVLIFPRKRWNKIVFAYRDNFFHDTLLLQVLSDHYKRNNLFYVEGMECYFRRYNPSPLTSFILASMTTWNYFNSALGKGTSQFSTVSLW